MEKRDPKLVLKNPIVKGDYDLAGTYNALVELGVDTAWLKPNVEIPQDEVLPPGWLGLEIDHAVDCVTLIDEFPTRSAVQYEVVQAYIAGLQYHAKQVRAGLLYTTNRVTNVKARNALRRIIGQLGRDITQLESLMDAVDTLFKPNTSTAQETKSVSNQNKTNNA